VSMADPDVQQRILVERLPSLLRDIYEGKLLLPDLMPAPWDDERRLRLFERIYRGLPIGGITVWRTSMRLPHRRVIGSVPLLDRGEGVSRDYLVDGLGWVVTLFAELGPAFWLGDKSSQRQPLVTADKPRPFLVFELQTQTFRLLEPDESLRPTEFALHHLFDAETQHVMSARLRALAMGEQWANRLSRFVGGFFDFSFPVTTVVSDRQEIAQVLLTPLEEEPSPLATAPRTTRWYCDACGQPIRHSTEGWVEWLVRIDGLERSSRGLRLVHHRPASPRPQGCQYNAREEFHRDRSTLGDLGLESFLGPDGLTQLLSLFSEYNLPREQVIEMLKRLHTPGYERARFHAQDAATEGVIEPNLPPGFYWQDELAKVLEFADAAGLKP
jgi:hypothetical protein